MDIKKPTMRTWTNFITAMGIAGLFALTAVQFEPHHVHPAIGIFITLGISALAIGISSLFLLVSDQTAFTLLCGVASGIAFLTLAAQLTAWVYGYFTYSGFWLNVITLVVALSAGGARL